VYLCIHNPTRHQLRAKKTSRLRELDKDFDGAQLNLFTLQ
jgi:hypothetical protein